MWKNRLKELLYILENSNVNEIDVTFFGVRYRVVKNSNHISEPMPTAVNEDNINLNDTLDTDSNLDQDLDNFQAETNEFDENIASTKKRLKAIQKQMGR